MTRTRIHINTLHLSTILLTIFALFPCDVKEPVFQSLGIEYNRPLNKNKTVQKLTDTCETTLYGNFEASIPANDEVHFPAAIHSLFSPAAPHTEDQHFIFANTALLPADTKPPMYILYQRLKLDLTLKA
ncbi:hypothetical protein SAMN05444274_10931 [Mariniphaga anaerophila]|uniref:Uncharacterized protein n=1 Tax=Mariniphaga anaerophila TaxID=1484053 RepID=A0A1M5EH41_9BACT|nr:hypothetical protein [Mariniphaga anaerophila]SHF78454.1 hypothetical protein SAMN05444274_10931 [Mariniphaga anaerophila]